MQTRLVAADRIRGLDDFTLPKLDYFNSEPCPRHTSLADGQAQIPPCRYCGVNLRRHQRIGVAWLYMRGKGLIADQMGLGKTAQAAGLIACCKQGGELDSTRRFVIITRASAVPQWTEQLTRFLPTLNVTSVSGPRARRIETYVSGWEVMVLGYQMFLQDHELLDRCGVRAMVVDDVDPLRHPNNRTAWAIKRLARECDRVVVLTGTPLQKRLLEMHSILEPLDGWHVFGSMTRFKMSYVQEEKVRLYSPQAGRMVTTRKVTGYKNLDDFIAKLRPFVLRRTPEDIRDVDLPAISPHTVWLDLHPAQRERYQQLREQSLLTIRRAEGTTVRHADAIAQFTYGQAICAGLVALGDPDGPGTSTKLDWVENVLVDGDLSDDKVVVFAKFTRTVAALAERLTRAGVGHVIIWGREPDKNVRQARQNQFWDDPNCRVLIGTEAIEQSLNLQVARHLINVDQLLNPARMQQLAGRIRRDGSSYRTVYVHNLLTRDTQEEGILDLLQREQALADHVWGETNELYEALSPLALLQLIGRPRRRR
jgi:SNF2 family DNA or RNA helicase